MPPLRTVSRDTPKGRHFTKKQPLKGAVFCFQHRRAESRFPAAVQSRNSRSILPQSFNPPQPFNPAATVQSATVVQSAAAVQSRNSISNRLAFPRGFVTVTNAFRPSR